MSPGSANVTCGENYLKRDQLRDHKTARGGMADPGNMKVHKRGSGNLNKM